MVGVGGQTGCQSLGLICENSELPQVLLTEYKKKHVGPRVSHTDDRKWGRGAPAARDHLSLGLGGVCPSLVNELGQGVKLKAPPLV